MNRKYKEMWQEKFDLYCDQGMDEFDAATKADEYVQDYMEGLADLQYEEMKERRFYD